MNKANPSEKGGILGGSRIKRCQTAVKVLLHTVMNDLVNLWLMFCLWEKKNFEIGGMLRAVTRKLLLCTRHKMGIWFIIEGQRLGLQLKEGPWQSYSLLMPPLSSGTAWRPHQISNFSQHNFPKYFKIINFRPVHDICEKICFDSIFFFSSRYYKMTRGCVKVE